MTFPEPLGWFVGSGQMAYNKDGLGRQLKAQEACSDQFSSPATRYTFATATSNVSHLGSDILGQSKYLYVHFQRISNVCVLNMPN